jgi:Serine hydrolase (FSH1)
MAAQRSNGSSGNSGSGGAKLHILCLHGSRQDGEVFASRLKTLRKKLAPIAVRRHKRAPVRV